MSQPERNRGNLILVADDDEDVRELISLRLRRAGYDVVAAEDGKAAYELILQHRPAVAIVDIMMPHVYGLELTRRVRARADVGTTPILLLTASSQGEAMRRSFEVGADEFMRKPFSGDELLARIKKLLSDG